MPLINYLLFGHLGKVSLQRPQKETHIKQQNGINNSTSDGLVGVGQEEHELGLSNAFKTVNFRQVQQASLDSVNEVRPTFILFSHQGEHSEAGLN